MFLIEWMLDGCHDFWTADSAAEAQMALEQHTIGAFMMFSTVFLLWGACTVFMDKPPAIVHKIAAACAVVALVVGLAPPLIPFLVIGGAIWLYRKMRHR